jgi:hypothetical protein
MSQIKIFLLLMIRALGHRAHNLLFPRDYDLVDEKLRM